MKKFIYLMLLLSVFVFMFSGCTMYVYGNEEMFTENTFLIIGGIAAFGVGNLLFGNPMVGIICGVIFMIA